MRMVEASVRLENETSDGEKERSLLYLNVYDLTPLNNYLYWFGLGIFHSGIEVNEKEYAFGAHEYPTSGVFEVEPRCCPGFIFRRTILLGSTEMSRSEFRSFMVHFASKYHGDTYHLIGKNCNHFTGEVCLHLTGKSIPRWVNRLARLGSFFNWLLPEHFRIDAVRHVPDHPYSEDGSDSASSCDLRDIDNEVEDPNRPLCDLRDSDDEVEDPNRHLLPTPSADATFLQEKPVTLARELV